MPSVHSTVHVWIGHGSEESWVLVSDGLWGDAIERDFARSWRIRFENTIFLPLCLVFLLDGNERISLFGLRGGKNVRTSLEGGNGGVTYTFQLLCFGDCGGLQSLRGSIYSGHDYGLVCEEFADKSEVLGWCFNVS